MFPPSPPTIHLINRLTPVNAKSGSPYLNVDNYRGCRHLVPSFTGPLVPLASRVLPFINIEANNNNNNNSDLRSADFHHPLSPPEYSRNARRISLSKLLARILDEGNSQSRRVSIIGRASSARFFRDAFSRRGADRLSTPDRT